MILKLQSYSLTQVSILLLNLCLFKRLSFWFYNLRLITKIRNFRRSKPSKNIYYCSVFREAPKFKYLLEDPLIIEQNK